MLKLPLTLITTNSVYAAINSIPVAAEYLAILKQYTLQSTELTPP
jgi:hypothetical protein